MPYHEGYREALNQADSSSRENMLDWLDGLCGADNLNVRATDSEIRTDYDIWRT